MSSCQHPHPHDDDHGHSHNHDHGGHHHHHAPGSTYRAFVIAVTLNGALTVLQIIYAYVARSNSLLADAGHNLGDVLGLIFSWLALYFSQKVSTDRYSYGYKKSTILASLLNAVLLLVASVLILAEAGFHLVHEIEVRPVPVMVVAGLGIILNGGSALLFMKKSKDDLNIKSAFLHLVYDALTSFSVVLGGALIYFTGINWIDPLVGIAITLFILKNSAQLFKHTLDLSLDGVPRNINYAAVKNYLSTLEGVVKVHDLHIWALSTTQSALTVHLVRPAGNFDGEQRQKISETLRERFKIAHTTLQVEEQFDEECQHAQLGC